jgi:BMFP domain-containing protein YqiC
LHHISACTNLDREIALLVGLRKIREPTHRGCTGSAINGYMPTNTISNQILEALEQGSQIISSLGSEARQQFQAIVEDQLNQMDVVSRSEFDALKTALSRANERIKELESKLGCSSS